MTGSDLLEAAKAAPGAVAGFVKGVGKTAARLPDLAAQTGYNLAGGSPAEAAQSANPETREMAKRSVEAAAALESGTTSFGGLIGKALDSLADHWRNSENERRVQVGEKPLPGWDPKKYDSEKDLTRLFNDAAAKAQEQQAAEGKGEILKSLGYDADTLHQDGVDLDPKAIADMSGFLSPWSLLPFVSGAKVVKAGQAFNVVNASGQVIAKSALREGAEKFVEKTAGYVAKAAKSADSGLAKITDKAPWAVAAAGAHALTTLNPAGVIGVAKGAAAAYAARGVAKAIQATAEVAGNPAVYSPLLDYAGAAAKGAVTGTALGAGLAAAEPLPEDAANALVTSAAFGAAGGAHGLAESQGQKAVFRGAQHVVSGLFSTANALQPVANFNLPNATPAPALAAQHAATMTQLQQVNPWQANLLNRKRAAMAASGVNSYLVTPEYAKTIGLSGADGAFNTEIPQADGSTQKGLVWVMGKDGVGSLTHEVGHFVDEFIATPEQRDAMDKANAKFQPGFDKKYLSFNHSPEYRKSLTPEKLKAELRAETFSGLLANGNFGDLPAGMKGEALNVLAQAAEHLGLYTAGMAAPGETGDHVTEGTLKFKQSPIAASIAREVTMNWGATPEVKAAIKGIEDAAKPGATPAIEPAAPSAGPGSIIPATALASTPTLKPAEEPAPEVTPAHRATLAGLETRLDSAAYEALAGVQAKVEGGEPLNADELKLWNQFDALVKENPLPGSAPVPTSTPEAPTPVEPKTAAPVAVKPEEIKPAAPVAPVEPAKPATPATVTVATAPKVEAPNIRVTKDQQNDFSAKRAEETGITEAKKVAADSGDADLQKKVDEISGHMQNGNPVLEVEHLGIASEGTPAAPEGRSSRRETQAEGYASLKELQDENRKNAPAEIVNAHQKTFVPVRWTNQGGTPTLIAMSMDKVIANVHRAVKEISGNTKTAGLVPYEVEGGKLTDAGWQQAVADIQAYNENQANGYRGNGEKLNRPADNGASIPAENPKYTPKPLSEEKESFINLVQGLATPETAKIMSKSQTPGNIKAQDIALANNRTPEVPNGVSVEQLKKQQFKAPYVGRAIKETNPLRNKLAANGVKLSNLIEVTERIRAKDVQAVKPRPDINFKPPVTDIIRAGFMPSEEVGEVERIAKLSPEDFSKEMGQPGSAARRLNVRFGLKMAEEEKAGQSQDALRSKLESLRDASVEKTKALLQAQDFNAGIAEGTKAAWIREAIEASKDPERFQKSNGYPSFMPSETAGPVEDVARDYAEKAGIKYTPPSTYVPYDRDLGKALAAAYDKAAHNPDSPAVKKSYEALSKEVIAQYKAIEKAGYTLEPVVSQESPYKNGMDVKRDLEENKHMFFNLSESAFGSQSGETVEKNLAHNHMLERSGISLGGKEMLVNDLFRAIHDFFGHARKGVSFGPRGEFNAWREHAALFSKAAQGALAAETIGQTAWTQFGPHLLDKAGNVLKPGDEGFTPRKNRPFADQKNILLPDELTEAAKKHGEVVHDGRGVSYMPSEDPRAVKAAAIRHKEDGTIYEGPMHFAAYGKATADGHAPQDLFKNFEDGFTTNTKGEFLTREQAAKRAEELNQVSTYHTPGKGLISENVNLPGDRKGEKGGMDAAWKAFMDGDGAQFMPAEKTGKVDNEDILPLHHYSERTGLKTLDPRRHGEGLPGAERARMRDYPKLYPKRTYFGMEGYQKEESLGGHRYETSMSKKDAYDFQADPDNLYPSQAEVKRKGFAPLDRGAALTIYENKIKKAGYKGYFNSEAKVLAKFDKTDVEQQYMPSATAPDISDFKDEKTVGEALKKEGWAVLTANQESVGLSNHPDNLAANDKLEEELKADGFKPHVVEGSYKGVDQGKNFLVTGITPEEALSYGKKYGQESVLVPEGLLYQNGTVTPVDHAETTVGSPAEKQDFYSRVKGGPAFSVGFDWSKRVPLREADMAAQFMPSEDETPRKPVVIDQLELGKPIPPIDRYDRGYIKSLTPEQLAKEQPEAIHGAEGEIGSDILGSPRYKAAPNHEAAVEDFASVLKKEYKDNEHLPETQAGRAWYDQIAPELHKFFKKDAPLFAELLAATSPQSNPFQNFKKAFEAWKLYRKGWYDESIAKFKSGMNQLKDGSLMEEYLKDVPENKRPEKISPSTLLNWFIDKHDLKPTKAPKIIDGKVVEPLFDANSKAVLKVVAREWLNLNKGPKTGQFVQNLLGTHHGATIDLWADRTMREAGYKGFGDKPWRIKPENKKGVDAKDFDFAQEVFAKAAKDLNLRPDELQGALWFIEKSKWAKNGWSPLDMGSYIPSLQELNATTSVKKALATVPSSREEALNAVKVEAKKAAAQERADQRAKDKARAIKNSEIQAIKRLQKRQQPEFGLDIQPAKN